MSDYYADSSALLKRHLHETGTTWVRALIDPVAGNSIIAARISEVEVYSALNRRVREGTLAPADYAVLVIDFAALCQVEYDLVELSPTIVTSARRLLEHYPLRAYDAVQLASALSARDSLAAAGFAAPIFLSSDERLLNAARAEGLQADNPNWHP